MKRLEVFSEDIYKCTKCGFCQSVCPVFQETGLESAVSRGKFALLNGIINGEIPFSKKISKYLEMCLGCRACFDYCPSGISAEEVIAAAKFENSRMNGIGLIKKIIISNFNSRIKLKLLKFLLTLYSKLGFIHLTNFLANYLRDIGKVIKLFNFQLKSNISYKKLRPAKNKSDLKIVFFPGCISSYVNSGTKNAALVVLEKNGYDVQIIEKFSCCGIPARSAGDYESFKKLARNNIELIPDDIDYLITDCASCGSVWEHYSELFDGELSKKADLIAKKAININKFIVEHGYYIPESVSVNKTVTFHDPCHLKRFQGVSKEPRSILKAIPGIDFIEMQEADKCCGAAGTFCVFQRDISKAISAKKAENIIKTKAEIVSTSCPSCTIGIAQGLIEKGVQKTIYTPIELLAELYILEDNNPSS